jgi:hypothetical protein
MRMVSKIDAAGIFEADVRIEDDTPLPAGCIESRPPEGLYTPKWSFASSEWVEGKPEPEIVEDLKTQKISEFADRAIDDLSPLFTEGKGRDETMLLLAGHVLQICEALNISADPRLSEVVSTGQKALTKKEEVEQAATVEELEAISWTP